MLQDRFRCGSYRWHGPVPAVRGRKIGHAFFCRMIGGEFLLLLFRQLLILAPLSGFLRRIQPLRARKAFACDATLFRREFDPFAHALLDSLLFVRLHRRKFVADFQPFSLAQRIDFIPFDG